MRKKMLFIFNGHAGKSQIRTRLLDILDIFIKHDYEVTVHATQKYLDAIDVVKERSAGYDLLVCSGGDGTLNEVVSGMMQCEKKIPIGYIPAGSTNDFAISLELPKSMRKAALAVVEGEPFSFDIGVFNKDYFVYIAAFGLFTDVAYQTKQEMKNLLGHMAYILEGVKRLYAIDSYWMKVEYGDQVIEDDFIFGMITNSTSVGGFKNIIGKNVDLQDGLFEVTLIKRPTNALELQEIAASLVLAEPDEKYMWSFKAEKLKITAKEYVPWTLDGEFGGEHLDVEVYNDKQAMQIMVEKDADAPQNQISGEI